MSELKPCPWCGETPEMVRNSIIDNGELIDESYKARHFCTELYCFIETRWRTTEEAVAESWNRRANDGD